MQPYGRDFVAYVSRRVQNTSTMGLIDPEHERQRLAKLYSRMSDGELEKVGEEPEDLTEWARDELKNEMGKRGLTWRERGPVKAEVLRPGKGDVLVLLGVYTDTMKASLDKSVLEAAGIEAHFFGENAASQGGLTSWVESDGIRLLVRLSDLLAAQELLDQGNEEKRTAEAEREGTRDASRPAVLRQYRDITAAMVDRTALERAGIECWLYDDNLVRMDWFVSNAIGGVKLVVAENHAREAEKIRSQAPPEDPDGTRTPS
jgi:hypothetical protein